MPSRLLSALIVISLAVPASLEAKQPPSVASQRRKELDKIEDSVFRKPLLARKDLAAAGPPPAAGFMIEMDDGSFYRPADKALAFEELGPAMIERASLRKDGTILMLTLAPPSRMLTPSVVAGQDPTNIGVSLAMELDVDASGGVRQALESVVYLPGQVPDEETVARCLARYPDMDEKRSRIRCGMGGK